MAQDIHNIKQIVADECRITVLDLCSARRTAALARTRQMAMWLARHLTPHSLPEIGRAFGDRDHTTVMHGIAVIDRVMAAEPLFARQVMELAERIDFAATSAVRRAMA